MISLNEIASAPVLIESIDQLAPDIFVCGQDYVKGKHMYWKIIKLLSDGYLIAQCFHSNGTSREPRGDYTQEEFIGMCILR